MSTVNLQIGRDNKVLNIATIQIRPNRTQPRRNFDEKELKSLSRSIVENGILQPLVVRRINSTEFELIAGERRLRAAVMAGLNKVPCVIHKCNDKDSALLALIENLQRTDLNMFEEARGIARLIRKYGLTQEQAAIKLGKKQSTIANKLRLLRLGFEEQEWIMTAHLSERHARTLLRINNEALRREVLSRIIAEGLSVTQAEELVTDKILSDLLSYVNRYSDKLRLSNSSTSSPKSLRAALTGSGVLMSTPAIFKREIGSVLHPPERKRL